MHLLSSETFNPHSNQLILECRIHSDKPDAEEPNISVTWLKNGRPLYLSGDRKYSMIRHENGRQQLLVSQPDQGDSGRYSCRLETSEGHLLNEASKIVNCVVPGYKSRKDEESHREERSKKVKPNLSERKQPIAMESFLKNMTVEEGQRAKFVCSTIGPVTSVEWLRDNRPLTTNEDNRYTMTNSNGIVSLEIQDVEFKDAGFYTCNIKGPRNNVSSSSRLCIYASSTRKRPSFGFADRPPISIPSVKSGKGKLVSRKFNLIFFSFFPDTLVSMKSSVPSMERLIRSSRTPSLMLKSDLGYSSLLSLRSKSYHDNLDNIIRPSFSRDISSTFNFSRSSSIRNLFSTSLSAHDLSRNDISTTDRFNTTNINAYAKHYSHHDYSERESRLTSRNRFKARSAFRAARSRSADRTAYASPVRDAMSSFRSFDLSLPRISRSLHDLSSRARSISRMSAARDYVSPWLGNSYHNLSIRTERPSNEIPTSSADWMYDIMNKPNFYLRKMRNLRESRSAPKRWTDTSSPSYYDGFDTTRRYGIPPAGDRSIYKCNRLELNVERNRFSSLFASDIRGNIIRDNLLKINEKMRENFRKNNSFFITFICFLFFVFLMFCSPIKKFIKTNNLFNCRYL